MCIQDSAHCYCLDTRMRVPLQVELQITQELSATVRNVTGKGDMIERIVLFFGTNNVARFGSMSRVHVTTRDN